MWIWIVITFIGAFLLGLAKVKEKPQKPRKKSLWKQLRDEPLPKGFNSYLPWWVDCGDFGDG